MVWTLLNEERLEVDVRALVTEIMGKVSLGPFGRTSKTLVYVYRSKLPVNGSRNIFHEVVKSSSRLIIDTTRLRYTLNCQIHIVLVRHATTCHAC